MQQKDLKTILIILTIIQLGVGVYYTPNNLRYIFHSISNFNYFDTPFYFANVLKQLLFTGMTIIGLVGVGIYFFKGNKLSNKALKIFLIHHFFGLLSYLPNRLIMMFNPPNDFSIAWYHHLIFVLGIMLVIVSFIVYYNQSIRIIPGPVNNKGIRFVHYLVDLTYVNIMILGNVFFLMNGFNFSIDKSTGLGLVWVIMILFPIVYYFFSEMFFRQTIGKVLTNTYLASANGQKAGFAKVLGRSFCRLIPFDNFSFLVDEGKWHDRFSGTDLFYKSSTLTEIIDNPMEDAILDRPIS